MMKKSWLLLPLLLTSCSFGGSSSSSVSSWSKPEIIIPKGRRIQGKGNLSYTTALHAGGTSTKYAGKIEGLALDASLNQLPSVLSDLFSPVYYEDLLLDGKFYFDSLSYGSVQGKTTQSTTIAKSEILFAMSGGDLYLDISDVERPEGLGFTREYIPDRMKFEKPFTGIEKYDPNIPLPLTDLPSLLMGAVDFDAFQDYIDIRPFDPNTLKISYVLNDKSIQALVDNFVTSEEPIDVTTILPTLDPSNVAFYFNVEESRLSRLDITLGFDLDIARYITDLAEYFDPFHINMDLEIPIDPVETVTPKIEGDYGSIDMEAIRELLDLIAEAAGSIPTPSSSSSERSS